MGCGLKSRGLHSLRVQTADAESEKNSDKEHVIDYIRAADDAFHHGLVMLQHGNIREQFGLVSGGAGQIQNPQQ